MWGASGRPFRIFRSGVPTVVRRAVPAGTLGGGPAGADTPGRFAPLTGAAGRGVRRYTRTSGSERSNANLPFASSLPGQRVLAREAGVAVALAVAADRLVDAVERQVGQRVGPELLGDLLDRAVVGDHLLARGHVDAVVAGMLDRRRGDPHVDLARARVAQHLHDLARRVAAHDRVVDDDEPLAADDLGQRVELHPQAVLAQLLAGLDEGPRDVAVLDEAVVLRQPARAREAARRRVAGVGHGDDEVGARRRRLAGEDLAHPPARGLQDVAAHARVGPGEVDVLEDAERLARRPRRSAGCGCRPRRARRARRARRRAAAPRR